MSAAPLLTRPVGDRDGVVRSTMSGAYPRRLACVLLALDLVVVVTSAVVIRVVAPGMSSLTAALIVTAPSGAEPPTIPVNVMSPVPAVNANV